MSDWLSLFRKPVHRGEPDALDDWFGRIAERLLNGSHLVVAQQAYRLVEIEFYYWSDTHPDPFTHRDPIQFNIGHWYFHRTRGTLRGGSFKGLDLTFGDGSTSGGILIRGLETPAGTLIDGPSLCVDHLLDATGAETVAVLERTIDRRLAWDDGNPLQLRQTEALDERLRSVYPGSPPLPRTRGRGVGGEGDGIPRKTHPLTPAPLPLSTGGEGLKGRPLIRSPRVGLFLKKAGSRTECARYVMRPYRYLTEPRRTKKGKIHMVLALHARGDRLDDIQRLTNCPRRAMERYIADFETGRKEADFTPYFGIDLGPRELCKLYGVWCAHFQA